MNTAPPRTRFVRFIVSPLKRVDSLFYHLKGAVDTDTFLFGCVAVANRYGVILERLVIDREAVRRTHLIVASIALADRLLLIVAGIDSRFVEVGNDLPSHVRQSILLNEWKYRDFEWRQTGVKLEKDASLRLPVRVHAFLFGVCVA